MTDYQDLRRKMVDNQIRPADVTDHRVIAAFGKVARELFVPEQSRPFAYADREVAIDVAAPDNGAGRRYLSSPGVLARLVQALEVTRSDVVLDIACGGGYSAAILAELAGSVLAIEETDALVTLAEGNLAASGADSVAVTTAPLEAGLPAEGPYDAILVAGGVERVPDAWKEQLNDGGRLVVVECRKPTGQAWLYRRTGDDIAGWPLFDAVLPVLPELARKPEFVF